MALPPRERERESKLLLDCSSWTAPPALIRWRGRASRYTISRLYTHYSFEFRQTNFSFYCDLWVSEFAHVYEPSSPCGYYLKSYPGRPAAAALFSFSFVWPHLKLVLMHLFFYLPLPSAFRRNGNYWFAFFGKWSLTDVLTMVT